MDVRHQSILVSNHVNWELSYEDSQHPKATPLSMVAALVVFTVAWPIFYLLGALLIFDSSFNYFKARWNQYKIINIITNNQNLEKYSVNRIKCCETQIENLKAHAIFLMKKMLKNPTDLELPIPQKKGILDYLSSRLPKDYWKDFSWHDFVKTNFYQKSTIPGSANKNILLQLEKVRTKINFLSHQKEVLSNPEERLEAIKKIAEMSFVKNAFIRQKSKEWIVRSFLWLLPSGAFWTSFFDSQFITRLTYEGNKKFLAGGTNLQTYDDLIDAHNKLVRTNDFIVPYIEYRII